MENQEFLLGFDAREMWLSVDESWSKRHRQEYLLREDVDRTLSADVMVWSSVFDADKTLILPDWTGVILWEDLYTLKSTLNTQWQGSWKPCAIIAVTAVDTGDLAQEQKYWDERLNDGRQPDQLNPNWLFLGYDVADIWLLSGLSNCGYEPQEKQELEVVWKPHLSRTHLFNTLDAAIGFQKASNERVQEHAPFFVYGLYLIELTTGNVGLHD